ncbi:MAG TPA: 3'-5' exonuclease [Candidatus Saccharibacteria bacterium]|jgi:DNA helicase-2/ATP-dependent DNA helicase PcrA|nr:3'-5' exonuclease [Candidatus Saccharibacteria bacterium]
MVDILDGLNAQQKEAVLYDNGPLLVLAGAGSGKTKTLTHKIAYLLNSGLRQEQILALTFTNKAAKEMRDRIADLLKLNNSYSFMPFMGTFHSICVKLLRIDGSNIKINSNFVIYDESDKLAAIKRSLKSLNLSEKDYSPKTISSIISESKNRGLEVNDYALLAKTPIQKVAVEVMVNYQAELKNSGALDFDDLLLKSLNLIKNHNTIREKWRNHFKYILVDEYQDTNQVQYQLIKLLINDSKNICVVGDDWQSVYSWRGADYTNILNFERDFRDSKVIKLEQNYRSTGNILDIAGKVIAKNKNKADKKLWTDIGEGEPIKLTQASNEIHEADIVVDKIKLSDTLKLNEIAILYRTNAQSRALEEALMRFNIPYQLIGGTRFYDRKEIKDILSYLNLVYQPDDIASFLRAVNSPSRGLGKVSLDNFLYFLKSNNLSLSQALTELNSKDIKLTPRAIKALSDFKNLIDRLNDLSNGSEVHDLINKIITFSGYKDYLKSSEKNWEERLENLNELVNLAKQYTGYSLDEFLQFTALQTSGDDSKIENSVKLMTLHASKGLEFDTVFMVGMEENIFPSSRSLSDLDQLEEERRLCYVGMTRARKRLNLSFATKRLMWGNINYNLPSRFLEEAELDVPSGGINSQNILFGGSGYGYANAKPADPNAYFNQEQKPVDNVLSKGDKVKHSLFGIGFVEFTEGSDATITFSSGRKKLNLEYASLEKL